MCLFNTLKQWAVGLCPKQIFPWGRTKFTSLHHFIWGYKTNLFTSFHLWNHKYAFCFSSNSVFFSCISAYNPICSWALNIYGILTNEHNFTESVQQWPCTSCPPPTCVSSPAPPCASCSGCTVLCSSRNASPASRLSGPACASSPACSSAAGSQSGPDSPLTMQQQDESNTWVLLVLCCYQTQR